MNINYLMIIYFSLIMSSSLLCAIDGSCFKNPGSAYQHKKLHQNEVFSCDLCPKVFSTKMGLTKHKTIDAHSTQIFTCDSCNYKVSRKKQLKTLYHDST